MNELVAQFDLSLRLLLAAALGALIGVEREIHGHPAGMRTHLLVALGAAIFTVLSIYGFGQPGQAGLDPSRIAAQIVSGIGFLGAGAILKEGATIRGLTTAASLWATAAVGLAAGAAQYPVAWTGAIIIIFSLWPLNRVAERLHAVDREAGRIQVTVDRLEAIGEISQALAAHRLEITGVQTERLEKRRYAVTFDVRRRGGGASLAGAIEQIGRIGGVEVAGTDATE
ncbi:MAG TPA: MgtC/SapB family protein [Candidatus Limnocylindrales bacterium]|jgi:putative Mg2+ transporter-C (MgtC) family protein|nr:MgtC/SapB family protein [Candidatus Limnocylindrales bacterium]